MKTKSWILIFLVLALICAGMMIIQFTADRGNVVTITQDGAVLHTIDLSKVTEAYELTIPYGEHYNTIRITPDGIWVSRADCSNQVCVNHGILRQSGAPITCLPHHLIISWAESQVDA